MVGDVYLTWSPYWIAPYGSGIYFPGHFSFAGGGGGKQMTRKVDLLVFTNQCANQHVDCTYFVGLYNDAHLTSEKLQ